MSRLLALFFVFMVAIATVYAAVLPGYGYADFDDEDDKRAMRGSASSEFFCTKSDMKTGCKNGGKIKVLRRAGYSKYVCICLCPPGFISGPKCESPLEYF